MRKMLISTVLACAFSHSAAWALKPGDAVTVEALGKAAAIQGKAPEGWEPGKFYLLACWATWDGPSVAAIPQTDSLFDKYKDKGLNVIGVNVWEEDKQTVAEFVKKKGEGMSYPVLFTGGVESEFETDWFKPAGVETIPTTLLVKDGKLIARTHPKDLSESVIEGLLAGGEKQEAALKALADAASNDEKLEAAMIQFDQVASLDKDPVKMAAALAEIEKLSPRNPSLPLMRAHLLIVKKDWAGVAQTIQSLPKDESIVHVAIFLEGEPATPQDTHKAVLAKMRELPDEGDAVLQVAISRVQWLSGDKEAAKASAKKAVGNPGDYPLKVMAAYAASLDGGTPQTLEQFFDNLEAAVHGEE